MHRGGFNDSEMDYFSMSACLRAGRFGVFHWHGFEELTVESGRMKLGDRTMDNHRQNPRDDLHPHIGSLPRYRGFTAGVRVVFSFFGWAAKLSAVRAARESVRCRPEADLVKKAARYSSA